MSRGRIRSETKHKTYGVTTRRTYATVIYDVHGKRHEYALTQDQVNTLLQELGSRVPWAIIGFGGNWQKAWAKKRSDVLAQVAEPQASGDATDSGRGDRRASGDCWWEKVDGKKWARQGRQS